jgi:hypothetical protein
MQKNIYFKGSYVLVIAFFSTLLFFFNLTLAQETAEETPEETIVVEESTPVESEEKTSGGELVDENGEGEMVNEESTEDDFATTSESVIEEGDPEDDFENGTTPESVSDENKESACLLPDSEPIMVEEDIDTELQCVAEDVAPSVTESTESETEEFTVAETATTSEAVIEEPEVMVPLPVEEMAVYEEDMHMMMLSPELGIMQCARGNWEYFGYESMGECVRTMRE